MKTFLTILITAVVVTAVFLWISTFKPLWLVRLQYDETGFPRVKVEGDRFIFGGKTYIYLNGEWIVEPTPLPGTK